MGDTTVATQIAVTRIAKSRLSEELRENSPFGTNYSDHMFVADYNDGEWNEPRIVPFGVNMLGPVLIKYATDNGFGMIVDTSQPWPQSPVVWWGESVDVTKSVVDVYNAQSGVAPPPSSPSSGGAKPAVTKPAGTKPTTPPVKQAEPPK